MGAKMFVSFTVLAKTASMNPKNFNKELLRPGILYIQGDKMS